MVECCTKKLSGNWKTCCGTTLAFVRFANGVGERRLNRASKSQKPLEQILESLLKHSPTLANLFQFGNRASNPFKTINTGAEERPYEGKQYPTYFKFKGRAVHSDLQREGHLNARTRIAFETNAVNDYFTRSIDAGRFNLWLVKENVNVAAKDLDFSSNTSLQSGIASLSIRFPVTCKVGDRLQFIGGSDGRNPNPTPSAERKTRALCCPSRCRLFSEQSSIFLRDRRGSVRQFHPVPPGMAARQRTGRLFRRPHPRFSRRLARTESASFQPLNRASV